MSITQEQFTAIFEQIWTAVDKDGSGALEFNEVRQIAVAFHDKFATGKTFDEARFKEEFDRVDTNKSGKIEKNELLQVYMQGAQEQGLIA